MAENNIDPEQIRQINEALLDLTGTVRQTEIAMANLSKVQKSQVNKSEADEQKKNNLTKEEIKNLETFNSAISNVNASGWDAGLQHLAKTSPKTAIGLEALATAASGFVKGTLQMTKALHEGERGAEVGAKAVTTFAESISTAGKLIGAALMFIPGLGIAARVAGAALAVFSEGVKKSAELNEIGAKQNDKVFKSFNDLSKSGLVASRGMTDVFDNLQTMRMTTAELEKFNSLLIGNSKDLKMFGATTADGAAKFAKVAGGVYDNFNKSLGMLGVTAEEQREHTLRYMAQQTRMGLIQGKSVNDLVKGSKNYIEELDRLATLTGASRKEQEEARDAILKIEELRAAMYDAEQSGDKAEAARLEKYFKLASALQASGDTRGAMGAAQYAAGKGIVGAESAAFYQTYKGAVRAIEQGKSTSEALVEGAKTQKELLTQVAKTKAVGGDVSPMLTSKFGEGVDNVRRMEEAQKLAAKNGISIEQALKELQKEKVDKADPKTKANVEMVEAQQRVAIKLDSVLDKYFDAAKIHKAAAEAMLAMTDKMADLLGHVLSDKKQKPINPTAAIREAQQVTSSQVARNELTQGRIGKEEAKAILDQPESPGKLRDIRDFGGREVLEKIASGAITPQAAAATPSSAMPSMAAPSRRNVPMGQISQPAPPAPRNEVNPLSGSESRPPNTVSANAPVPGGDLKDPLEQVKAAGLKVRPYGDVYQGGPMTPSALSAAKTIQETTPNFGMFTGLNDEYHQKVHPRSAHAKGKGIDFTLNKMPTVAEAKEIKKQLQSISGVQLVANEYYKPPDGDMNQYTTGPHFHVQTSAKYGGIVSGPQTGFPVMMHGPKEAIVPLATDSLLEKLGTTPAASLEKPTSTSSEMNNIFMMLTEKFDQMIEKLSDGVNIQDKILKYSRA